MKKIYLLASLFTFSCVAVAQTSGSTMDAQDYATELTPSKINYKYADRAPGDIVWVDSFEVDSDWLAGGTVSPNNALIGWSIGDTTGGWFFPTNGDMGTQGNFARFVQVDPNSLTDSPLAGPFTFEYVGGANNGAIDLTGVPAPHLEWEQYGARFITVQAIEISANGVDWFQAASNDDIPPNTATGGDVFGQPETRRFNMATALTDAVAAGGSLATIRIRLFWEGAQNGPNFNNIEYGWFVDNIRIVEGEEYETELLNPTYRWGVGGNVFGSGLEYHFIPQKQITAAEFSAQIASNGSAVQTGSNVSVAITHPTSPAASAYAGVSPSIDITGTGAIDSFVVAPTFTADDLGVYSVVMTANQDNTDADLTNNTFETTFRVTEDIYGRDNGIRDGGITNFAGNGGQPFAIGNMMEIFDDNEVFSIDIVVTNDADNVGQTIYGTIFKADGAGSYIEEIATEQYEITTFDLNGTPIRLNFPNGDSYPVSAGDDLIVMAGHLGGTDVRFATAQPTQTGTVLGVTADGSLGTLGDPNAVMVRLLLPDNLSVNETEFATVSVNQNQPNPFADNTLITYNLNEAANVSVEVIDVTGKVVATFNEGQQGVGEHNINISADQLSNGVYFYNFKAGNYSVTKRMVVSK